MTSQNNYLFDNILFPDNNSNQSTDSIGALITEYRPMVEAIASRYSVSDFDRDDLVQEGMIGLLAAIKSFKSDKNTSFKTYAGICIGNSIQSALRKTNRKKDIPSGNVVPYEEAYVQQFGSVASAEDAFLAGESVSLLSSVIEQTLSSLENEVLRLHMMGCNYNEIATRLNKDTKAIDNALQRIRKKLVGFF